MARIFDSANSFYFQPFLFCLCCLNVVQRTFPFTFTSATRRDSLFTATIIKLHIKVFFSVKKKLLGFKCCPVVALTVNLLRVRKTLGRTRTQQGGSNSWPPLAIAFGNCLTLVLLLFGYLSLGNYQLAACFVVAHCCLLACFCCSIHS